ncbi:MAG: transposase [Dehalococcoidia bacterium]
MTYSPPPHHRRSIRLPAYDYAQPGAYFLTVVTHQRQCLFGEVVDGQVLVSAYGEAVGQEWLRSTQIRREIQLDAFVVMPNHIHGIVIIDGQTVGAHGRAPPGHAPPGRAPPGRAPLHRSARSLGSFIAGFKSAVTKRINEMRRTPGLPVWQRNYYERVIRNEEELRQIRQYIIDNPAQWDEDVENPQRSDQTHHSGAVREPPLLSYDRRAPAIIAGANPLREA